ncbi:hypothetical protein ACFQJD_11085 [Haloplanus sp. GCM10025708]|uniref:hypothetical protein n=1 Tax=Haloferacaceae TaxID=1644056 RepID=UPI0036159B53
MVSRTDPAGVERDRFMGPSDRLDAVTDLPSAVRDRLLELLAEASDAARERREADVRTALDDVERLVRKSVDDEALAERLAHGCRAVEGLVDDEPLVAAEYLDAMERLVDGE